MSDLTPLFSADGDGWVVAHPVSRGPWSASALHGGPVAALLAWCLEELPATAAFHPGRFTLELHRPVPVDRLQVDAEVIRPGRRVRLLGARLHDDDGALLAEARLQQVRLDPGCGPVTAAERGPRPSPPDATPPLDIDWPASHEAFHSHGTEHRSHRSPEDPPGPTVDWIRVTRPLLEGRPLSPLQRAVAAADFANGISKVVPMDEYSFINPDLTVVLDRLPRGDWVCLDAETVAHGEGVGVARATLHDEDGRLGLAAQTLLIAPR